MAIMFFVLLHHLTGTSLIYLLALLNLLVPNLVPASKYLFKRMLGNPALTAVSHLFCVECQNDLGKQCGTSFIRETKCLFGSIPLRDLLRDTLENHGIDILRKTVKEEEYEIEDVMDGKMYQTLLKEKRLSADDLMMI